MHLRNQVGRWLHRGTLTTPSPPPPAAGGDKVLLHFVQKSPGDYAPPESILQALGISAEVGPSEPPQVSLGLGWALH